MTILRCVWPVTDLLETPEEDRKFTGAGGSQILWGEPFTVEEERGGYARGFCQTGETLYPGWVRKDALGPSETPPSHTVRLPLANVYAEPHLKACVIATLPFGALLKTEETRNGFAFAPQTLGWIFARAVRNVSAPLTDYVQTALLFENVPYLFGGRSAISGIDCSALVQLALTAAEIPCPRDSKDQREQLSAPLFETLDARTCPERGDIAFFPGHVGIMTDAETVLSANSQAMAVTCDPLETMKALYETREGQGLLCLKRRLG